MKNIETAIFPLLLVLGLCGLYVFEYRHIARDCPRLYFTIFYSLASWLLYFYIVMKVKILSEIFGVDFLLINYMIIVVALMFILLNIYYHKRFKSCLKKLDIVNETLEEFGIMKNYIQLRAQTIRIIIGWMVSIFLLNSIDGLWYFTFIPKGYVAESIYVPYVMNHLIHISTLNEITFIMLLRYIESLYEHVNQCIEKLIEQKKRQVRLDWATCTSTSFMHRHLTDSSIPKQLICLLMHMHLELSSISRELNKIFGLQIVMQAATFHLSAIQFTIDIYQHIIAIKTHFTYESAASIFASLLWVVRCLLTVILFNYICEGVCNKANRTETFLNRLANVTFDVETQEYIMQFLLEILRRPLRINGLGFYDYGCNYIQKFIQRAVQVILIVIQARAE